MQKMPSHTVMAIQSRTREQAAIWHVGENRNPLKVKVRKPKGMRPLGSPKHTQDNKKWLLKEVEWHDADWIHVGDLWRTPQNTVTTFTTLEIS
jgi:hypothetical protein